MEKQYKMTRRVHEALKEELLCLKTVRAAEVAEMIAEARSYGDLSENAEYYFAMEEKDRLYARIAMIEDLLAYAVISGDEPPADGHTSTITDQN